jgi:hypothetical protein
MQSKDKPSTIWFNNYVNPLRPGMQPLQATTLGLRLGTCSDFLQSPILTNPSGNQKQFSRRFSSFQIPMGLLRVFQRIEMLDAQF